MLLDLSQHETIENAFKWSKFLIQSSFKPAPSYVIMTESDCDIFSCSREDKIVYLPVALNDNHIDSIIRMNINMLNAFNSYINQESNKISF